MAKRDVTALSDILKSVPSLSPEDKQTVKTALMNKIGTLQNVSQRGVGASLGGAALGGASSALVGNLLSEVCSALAMRSRVAHSLIDFCTAREVVPTRRRAGRDPATRTAVFI